MLGSFLSRIFLLAFGYAYPAYECYKTVERNKPEIEQLLFWCQYWILVAVLTVLERFGDAFISWVPLYSEAKLAFFIYLWYPKTKGSKFIYEELLRPYLAQYENDIDRNILELRVRAGDVAVSYWQKAFTYSQATFFDVLQYVAAQSNSIRSRPTPAQSREVPAPTTSHVQNHLRRAKSKKVSTEEDLPEASTASVPNTPRLRRQLSARSGPAPSAPPQPAPAPKGAGSEPAPTDPEPSAPPAIIEEEEDVEMEEGEGEEEEEGVLVEEMEGEETTMEEAIRMTRTRLRKRVGSVDQTGSVPPPASK